MPSCVRSALVAVLVVTLSALPLARPAYAGWTADKCDPGVKYWCYSVFYYTYSGGVELSIREHWGSFGDGGAVWWKRWITQDWRYSGSWTFLGGWAPSAAQYTTGFNNVSSSRSVANEAVVRMQNRFKSTGQGIEWCDGYVDWHVSDTGNYWSQGPYGCLTPIY